MAVFGFYFAIITSHSLAFEFWNRKLSRIFDGFLDFLFLPIVQTRVSYLLLPFCLAGYQSALKLDPGMEQRPTLNIILDEDS